MSTILKIPFGTTYVKKFPREGSLLNTYVPFQNLYGSEDPETGFCINQFNTEKLSYSHTTPLEIDIQNYPDGSVNLIINNDNEKPKLINSRFSTTEESKFIIPDHFGNKDTSLYNENCLDQDTSLYNTVSTFCKINFEGLQDGGSFPCGTYHFYFKLSDNDGNESDFIGESSSVVCHIGTINDPFSIRMGMENENSEKMVLFTLSELDPSYDYVKIFYSRTTSGEDGSDLISYHEIYTKFPIKKGICNIALSGSEPSIQTTWDKINQMFYYCDKVKTQAICQNRLFLGNISEQYVPYDELKDLSLRIQPQEDTSGRIGALNYLYKDWSSVNKCGYYNAKNIYEKTGYWPEEYYRLGIVYIFQNYSCSSVFNISGDMLGSIESLGESPNDKDLKLINDLTIPIKYNDDGFILKNDNTPCKFKNKYGIIQFSKEQNLKVFGLKFNIPDSVISRLKELNIIGYFFVRQQRKPIILGQGVAIGKTSNDFGNIPVLKNDANKYFTESFLSTKYSKTKYLNLERDIIEISENYKDNKRIEIKAAIVPEAIVREPLYNQIFLGQDFYYDVIGHQDTGLQRVQNYRYFTNTTYAQGLNRNGFTQLLNIPSGVKIKTNGEDYYSSQAGYAEDVSTFISVLHDWKHEGNTNVIVGQSAPNNFVSTDLSKCIPFELKQDQLVRGVFGAYVGLGKNDMKFGDIFNIRKEEYLPNDSEYIKKIISLRSYDQSPYYTISDKIQITEDISKKVFYRGDCYICPFTHRIIRNHIDPELPTNDKIVDSQAWDDNFLVITKTKFEDQDSPTKYTYINEIVPLFKARNKWYIDEKGNIINVDGARAGAFFKGIADMCTVGITSLATIKQESIFEKDLEDLQWGDGSNVAILLPNDSKYSKIGNNGETWGVPNTWYEYGTRKISRSDVNSVGLGHWITLFVRSNINLCLRDINKYQISEKVIFNKERGFYPLYPLSLSSEYKLPESQLINGACNVSLSQKAHMILPDTPYIKQQYDTRIVYSNIYNGGWKNGFRVFNNSDYQDMPKTYGALVKLVEFSGSLLGVMEHGIIVIPVNERTIAASGAGGGAYINTDVVLPNNPRVLSDNIGSIWQHSVIKTGSPNDVVYGVDTSAKKIWKVHSGGLECISDMKLQKFLNDNIQLKEWEKACEIGFRDVKTHYNAFKKDVMFVFYNDDKQWHLCYNEYTNTFTTFYSWAPSYSANINNTFLTLDLEDSRNYINTLNNFNKTNFYKTYDKLNIPIQFIGNKSKDYICYYYDADTNTFVSNQQLVLNVNYSKCTNNKNPYFIKNLNHKDIKYHACQKYSEVYHPDNKYFTIKETEYNGGVYIEIDVNSQYAEELKNRKYIECKIQLEYWDNVINKFGQNDEKFITDFIIYRVNNLDYPTNLLWKHGQCGIYDGQHEILPTNWYNKQEPFEFEFVVQQGGWVQNIYHNLLILSNKVKPEEIQFEIIGDSYDWWKYKNIINFINSISANYEELYFNYLKVLTYTQEELYTLIWPNTNYPKLADKNGSYKYTIKSIPFISYIRKDSLGKEYNKFSENTSNLFIVNDDLLPEKHLRSVQKCNDIKTLGLIQGNIEYKEDSWWSEIRPMNFKLAYTKDKQSLSFKSLTSARIRDKYVKIKIKYSGKDLTTVRGISTLLEQSMC